MFDINERIIELRMERHWSEYQLAEKSGIGQSTISSWTRTKSMPTVPNLEKICNAFGITPVSYTHLTLPTKRIV